MFGSEHSANGAMYYASKYAQYAFTSALRKEVSEFNVNVNIVYPGKVESFLMSVSQEQT
ncbi:MAG: SDR family NAD(P)-dependent oxidoreductase [Flavobacterium sp.]|nr:SDR family NAD(P)-dependent oxidoreductase [Pedobacter sp.]